MPAGLLAATVVAAGLAAAPAAGYPGAPWFEPGKPYDQNFPDPAIIEVDGTYYAYATSTGGASLPVMTSTDLLTWIAHGEALGNGPSWSPLDATGRANVWAPTVVQLPTGGFMAAYASRTGSGDKRCIAAAYADSPLGPFRTPGSQPFKCVDDPNGALDPFLTVDGDGVPWLVWKNEGVVPGTPGLESSRTAFWSQQLTDDGKAWRAGSSVHFLMETTEQVREWQGTVVENPALIAHAGSWLLFYSANRWNSKHYATGFAVCETPGGPCREPSTQPLATSDDERWGPGGPAPVHGPDGSLMLGYHGWNPPFTDYPEFPACDTDRDGECTDQGQRRLYIDRVCIAGPTAFLFDDDGRTLYDVAAGSYFADAVDWLVAEDLTTGVSDCAYGPALDVTRAQMATFLWRLMGEPAAPRGTPFVDVAAGTFYADAVAWLAGAGITTGTTPSTYSPDDPVSRAQMAAFLCRLSTTPDYAASAAPTPAC